MVRVGGSWGRAGATGAMTKESRSSLIDNGLAASSPSQANGSGGASHHRNCSRPLRPVPVLSLRLFAVLDSYTQPSPSPPLLPRPSPPSPSPNSLHCTAHYRIRLLFTTADPGRPRRHKPDEIAPCLVLSPEHMPRARPTSPRTKLMSIECLPC
jgi:hypothetical protein